jgi:hypothetical protein
MMRMNNRPLRDPGTLPGQHHRCNLGGDKTRQGSARERTLKLAGYFFSAVRR